MAESRRPKGPSIRVIKKSRYGSSCVELVAELIRTTQTTAVVSVNDGYQHVISFKTSSGYRNNDNRIGDSIFRIHEDDLATVQAMKLGANVVSKAFDKLHKPVL